MECTDGSSSKAAKTEQRDAPRAHTAAAAEATATAAAAATAATAVASAAAAAASCCATEDAETQDQAHFRGASSGAGGSNSQQQQQQQQQQRSSALLGLPLALLLCVAAALLQQLLAAAAGSATLQDPTARAAGRQRGVCGGLQLPRSPGVPAAAAAGVAPAAAASYAASTAAAASAATATRSSSHCSCRPGLKLCVLTGGVCMQVDGLLSPRTGLLPLDRQLQQLQQLQQLPSFVPISLLLSAVSAVAWNMCRRTRLLQVGPVVMARFSFSLSLCASLFFSLSLFVSAALAESPGVGGCGPGRLQLLRLFLGALEAVAVCLANELLLHAVLLVHVLPPIRRGVHCFPVVSKHSSSSSSDSSNSNNNSSSGSSD
ncbi:hypothetical protein Esti_001050 [Eimeria stiedai]